MSVSQEGVLLPHNLGPEDWEPADAHPGGGESWGEWHGTAHSTPWAQTVDATKEHRSGGFPPTPLPGRASGASEEVPGPSAHLGAPTLHLSAQIHQACHKPMPFLLLRFYHVAPGAHIQHPPSPIHSLSGLGGKCTAPGGLSLPEPLAAWGGRFPGPREDDWTHAAASTHMVGFLSAIKGASQCFGCKEGPQGLHCRAPRDRKKRSGRCLGGECWMGPCLLKSEGYL